MLPKTLDELTTRIRLSELGRKAKLELQAPSRSFLQQYSSSTGSNIFRGLHTGYFSHSNRCRGASALVPGRGMDTTRVDICYRPLRIAWAIHSEDRDSFRKAVRLTHTLWGGRFNPIVLADRLEEAKQVVETFRADVIWPVGDTAAIKDFPNQFPHLITPLLSGDAISARDGSCDESACPRYSQHARPLPGDISLPIEKNTPISTEIYDHVSLGYLTRHRIRRHDSIRPQWDYAGFYVGDATDLDDVVRFWNIRAADIPVHFIDPGHLPRYAAVMPDLGRRLRADLSRLDEHRRKLAVWSRVNQLDDALKLFAGESVSACALPDDHWIGVLRPPMR